jgi:hypothetical protein
LLTKYFTLYNSNLFYQGIANSKFFEICDNLFLVINTLPYLYWKWSRNLHITTLGFSQLVFSTNLFFIYVLLICAYTNVKLINYAIFMLTTKISLFQNFKFGMIINVDVHYSYMTSSGLHLKCLESVSKSFRKRTVQMCWHASKILGVSRNRSKWNVLLKTLDLWLSSSITPEIHQANGFKIK